MSPPPPKGTVALLFSTLSRGDAACFVPAVALAIIAGVVPAIMAKIIGAAFNAFAQFNPQGLPVDLITEERKETLRRDTLQAVWQLCVLGGATMLLSTTMISLWIVIGERVARGWRLNVYMGLATKGLKWFDVDLPEKAGMDEGSGSVGAGGVMAKFARETDEVRNATSQTFGQTLETLSTILASLVLAFVSCWSLTLVVLASIPLTAVLVGMVQSKATPLHESEMENMARASNIMERCIQSITTVKAFTSEDHEQTLFMGHVEKATQAWNKLAIIYGGRMGLTATLTLAMFTTGFWYGSNLVQSGKASPGAVLTTFWSCLLVANGLSTIMTTLSIIEVGKVSAASLVLLISDSTPDSIAGRADDVTLDMDPPSPSASSFASVKGDWGATASVKALASPTSVASFQTKRTVLPMRKIRPVRRCQGEINMQNVSFSYPSRPSEPVLQNVSMFFPAGETTFIIGGSGSGKSTIGHLILRLYDGYSGEIHLDDQDVRYLDAEWTRAHIAAIDQTALIFDMSIRDNVALGRCGELSEEIRYKPNHVPVVDNLAITDACKMALLHNDIQRLERGYDTPLGSGGVDLSGGQKQRLALARAIIRDPTVLLLDECTSALDVKSRLLVTAFIKKWRRGKTTIIITHDLQQVDDDDFVYLLDRGRLVEQGYRMDVGARTDSIFSHFVRSQTGVDGGKDEEEEAKEELASPTGLEWHASKALKRSKSQHKPEGSRHARKSRWAADHGFTSMGVFDIDAPLPSLVASNDSLQRGHRRASSSVSSTASDTPSTKGLRVLQLPREQQKKAVQEEDAEDRMEMVSIAASLRRPEHRLRKAWSDHELGIYTHLDAEQQHQPDRKMALLPSRQTIGHIDEAAVATNETELGFKDRRTLVAALYMAWTTQPNKSVLLLGFVATVAGAAVQPAFSFVLGKLLATMGRQGQHRLVLQYSLIVLALAFADGVVQFLRFALLQYSANIWIRSLRARAIAKIFSQDKAWFDREENGSASLLTKLIKDGEDAKAFVSRIIGELILVFVLITTAFVWAIAVSWQLTLAGAAMAPVFYLVVLVQSRLIERFERQNKLQRERVSKRFYNMVHNIRGIRSMSLERVFEQSFLDAVKWVQHHGIRSAPFSGFGYGLKDACTYLAEALLYYVGAVLLIKGKLTLEGMMIVLNLILFAVTFAAQILAYLPGLSKSLQSIYDLVTILRLDETASSEYAGRATPLIYGGITFRDVHFSYPSRREEKVLDGCSFEIRCGEKVALVGQSGCGKSTIAALLCRIYEPDAGLVQLDNNFKLSNIRIDHLRKNLAFVQQRSDLFNDSIRNNILYGNEGATEAQLERAIVRSCCSDIVAQAGAGLETLIGDKASTISGGQKQRIAIARALVREEAKILILDECTSALDPTNQEQVACNLLQGQRPTTLIVTHKLEMMKRCDRILVLEHGKVVQSGHFDALMQQKGGAFSKLAHAGEWGA